LYTRNIEASFDDMVIKGETIPDIIIATSIALIRKLAVTWGEIKSN